MKKLLIILVLPLVFSSLFAVEWLWEGAPVENAFATGKEYTVQAVGDALYFTCIAPNPDDPSIGKVSFFRSTADSLYSQTLTDYSIDCDINLNLLLNLPEIHIVFTEPKSGDLVIIHSTDEGENWEQEYFPAKEIYDFGKNPIYKSEGGISRMLGSKRMENDEDVMHYYRYFQSMAQNNVYFYGRTTLSGSVRIDDNMHIKNLSGWPVFHGHVTLGGNVISHSGAYPEDEIFQGGLTVEAKQETNILNTKLFKKDYIENSTQMLSPYGENTILYLDIDGENSTAYWGNCNLTSSLLIEVWDNYPPQLFPNANHLYTNRFTVPDTLWIEIEDFTLPDKLYTDATVWVKGTFSGVKSIYSSEKIYTLGDILLANTPAGEDPFENQSDKLSLITDKQVLLKYGNVDPVDGERKHPNCREDAAPIQIYADIIALHDEGYSILDTINSGYFGFEYMHPHPSTPALYWTIDGEEYYFDYIDLHRRRFPQTQAEPWPALIDYPWYNPLWPEPSPYKERGTIMQYGALYQNLYGYMHRSGNDSEYPSNSGIWNIELDMCGGPISQFPLPDPAFQFSMGTRNYPGASGSGAGYKVMKMPDPRAPQGLPRREVWGLGSFIGYFEGGEPELMKWHKENGSNSRAKSIDNYADQWLYQVENILFSETESYTYDPGDDWLITEAKLLADGRVFTLQECPNSVGTDYRLVRSNLDGSDAETVYSTEGAGKAASLSRISDGFLLAIPNAFDPYAEVVRFNLMGNASGQDFTLDLPEEFARNEVSEAAIVFKNPELDVLHAFIWWHTEEEAGPIIHKIATIEPVSVEDYVATPAVNALNCYPNPFRNRLNISIEVEKSTPLNIGVYNIRGQRVAMINAGMVTKEKEITWDGRGRDGKDLPTGVYFLKVKGEKNISKKILKIK